jgi:hypothetical protein
VSSTQDDRPEEEPEDDDSVQGPDERDADLGWGGPELRYGPSLKERVRQFAFTAILLILLAAIILPLIITATR